MRTKLVRWGRSPPRFVDLLMTSRLSHPQIARLAQRYPDLEPCVPDVQRAFAALAECYHKSGKLLVCGNGGSAADSEHIVAELMKGVTRRRPIEKGLQDRLAAAYGAEGVGIAARLQSVLPAISLAGHPALQSAFANDISAELVFAQLVTAYGRPSDVLLALSTSGNSPNVVHAVKVAKVLGLTTIALTGRTGGKLLALCDTTICVPLDHTPDIQERHLPIYHALCIALEQTFFPE